MMHALRVIIVTILLFPGLMFPGPMSAGARRAADWPGQWVSEHGREHPLAGRILDLGAGRLIEPEAYLAALTAPLAADSRDPGFSYLTTRAEDEANFTSGAFVGFGFPKDCFDEIPGKNEIEQFNAQVTLL